MKVHNLLVYLNITPATDYQIYQSVRTFLDFSFSYEQK